MGHSITVPVESVDATTHASLTLSLVTRTTRDLGPAAGSMDLKVTVRIGSRASVPTSSVGVTLEPAVAFAVNVPVAGALISSLSSSPRFTPSFACLSSRLFWRSVTFVSKLS